MARSIRTKGELKARMRSEIVEAMQGLNMIGAVSDSRPPEQLVVYRFQETKSSSVGYAAWRKSPSCASSAR